LEHLLFAGYLILFAWLVTKVKFFTRSGLTPSQLIIVFLLKIMAGIFYGWIGVYYGNMAQMVDTWAYHAESLKEYQLLLSKPSEFFSSLFHSQYQDQYGGFLSSENSWWNDLHVNFLIKVLALFNIFSFGNYYINVIFYSFLTFFGPIALYRVMLNVFPHKKIAVLIATFLIPSFIYWTSGIHKDGIAFMGIALIIFHFYFGLKEARFGIGRISGILFGFLLIVVIRNYLVINIVPALIAWVLAHRLNKRPVIVYISVYAFFVTLFFTAQYIFPKLNLPYAVVEKQQAFLQLQGSSAVEINELKPTFGSFVANAPQAFTLSAVRPYPSDVKHLLSLAAAVEINLLLLLFLVFLLWRKSCVPRNPFILFCIFFTLSVLMTIGYTVHFLGAIVRYRSIVLPLVIVPVAAYINWERIGQVLFDIKEKNNF
jgi:hypothetical protein